MIDYFALLDQPRQPWLNLEQLQAKYRELARAAQANQLIEHDAVAGADINAAYRVLRDPKLRLQHLLALESKPPLGSAEVPADLVAFFTRIEPALSTGNRAETDGLLAELHQAYNDAADQLRELNERWNHSSILLAEADKLYRRFAFLTRWRELLEERSFSLAEY